MIRWTILSLLAVAAILLFAARHGTLRDLRAANNTLRAKLNPPTDPVAKPAPPQGQPTNPHADDLTTEEHAELLRLRGQIQPLRQELQELSKRIEAAVKVPAPGARASVATNSPGPRLSQEQQAKMQVMNAFLQSEPVQKLRDGATSLGQKVQEYLRNNGQLPQDLSELHAASDGFELMRTGPIPEQDQAGILVARLKEPLPAPDGKWFRFYIRADGTPVFAALPTNGDWTAWEQNAAQRFARRTMRKSE